MSLADEIERLAALHRNGELTAEEFAAAKAALLTDTTTPTPAQSATANPASSAPSTFPEDTTPDPAGGDSTSPAPRGWYFEPGGLGKRQRFWNGTNWTMRVRRPGRADEATQAASADLAPPRAADLLPPLTAPRSAAVPGTAPRGMPPGMPSGQTNGLAIASLVLGIVWLYWIGSLLAVIFGYIARNQIRDQNQSGDGLAVAGIVLGYVGLVVLGLLIAGVAGGS